MKNDANALRPQRPKVDGNWLHDGKPDYTRYFTMIVYLGKDAPEWAECTQAEREQFELINKQPEPEKEQQEEQKTEE